eukprot:SAG11_NODE_2076_length_3856_cov_15.369178_4_plen_151_part_00
MGGREQPEPSVERALDWFFGTVLPSVPGARIWRTANVLYYSKEEGCEHYVASVRDPSVHDYGTATHIALPFEFLRTVVNQIPQHCLLGDTVIHTLMLPQGSGISVPGSILQAAYQRAFKFESKLVLDSCVMHLPELLQDYSALYVDDGLT